MAVPHSQLALELPLEPRFGRENFLVSASNEAACAMIDVWPRWPDRVLLLIGPEGAGKTHLGGIWAERAGARTLASTLLPKVDLQSLVAAGALLVEDAHQIGVAETALFHLTNLVRESGAFLLLTARAWPDQWGLAIADLRSRLRLAPAAAIGAPDDALMRAVLVKLIADRQVGVEVDVVEYLARRIERSLAAAGAVVRALDRESLARQRRITKPMAGEILKRFVEESA